HSTPALAQDLRQRLSMDVRFPLLPPLPADGDHPTSVSCPSCAGTLAVRIHRTLITFVCYIGHVYSVPELLAAKEDRLEQRLWTALSSLAYSAMRLEGLERRGGGSGES